MKRHISPGGRQRDSKLLTQPRVIETCLRASEKKQGLHHIITLRAPSNHPLLALARTLHIPCEQSNQLEAKISFAPSLTKSDLITFVEAGHYQRLLVLDGVTDVGNLGAIARSAYLCGIDALICPKHESASLHTASLTASAGALWMLPFFEVSALPQLLTSLQQRDFFVYGAGADGESVAHFSEPSKKWVLVMGGEHRGIRPLVKSHCDMLLSIPMTRADKFMVESFNVSVAAGILLHAFTSKSP